MILKTRREIRAFILQALKKRKRINGRELIAMVATSLSVNEWDVKTMLWDITAAGQAEFCPGFKDVLYIDPSDPSYGDPGYC